ncbi:hypothetical protein TOC8171_40390 [Pseudomonas syringae]
MIDDGLEEARMDLAKIKASLETSLAPLSWYRSSRGPKQSLSGRE